MVSDRTSRRVHKYKSMHMRFCPMCRVVRQVSLVRLKNSRLRVLVFSKHRLERFERATCPMSGTAASTSMYRVRYEVRP